MINYIYIYNTLYNKLCIYTRLIINFTLYNKLCIYTRLQVAVEGPSGWDRMVLKSHAAAVAVPVYIIKYIIYILLYTYNTYNGMVLKSHAAAPA